MKSFKFEEAEQAREALPLGSQRGALLKLLSDRNSLETAYRELLELRERVRRAEAGAERR